MITEKVGFRSVSVEKLDENSGHRLFFYSTSSNSYDATIVLHLIRSTQPLRVAISVSAKRDSTLVCTLASITLQHKTETCTHFELNGSPSTVLNN